MNTFIKCLISIFVFSGFMQEASANRRQKREFDTPSILCAAGCVFEYVNVSDFTGIKDNAGSGFCKHASISQLDAICKIYHQGKSCVKKDCSGKPLIDKLLEILNYACDDHYDEIKKHLPCFTQSCTYIENACQPKCGKISDAIKYTAEQKETLEAIDRLSKARQGQNTDAVTPSSSRTRPESEEEFSFPGGDELDVLQHFNLDGGCTFVNCYMNCSEKPLKEKCGIETYTFLRKAVLDLLPMVFDGLWPNTTQLPASCQKVLDLTKEITKSGSAICNQFSWGVLLVTMTLWFGFLKKMHL